MSMSDIRSDWQASLSASSGHFCTALNGQQECNYPRVQSDNGNLWRVSLWFPPFATWRDQARNTTHVYDKKCLERSCPLEMTSCQSVTARVRFLTFYFTDIRCRWSDLRRANFACDFHVLSRRKYCFRKTSADALWSCIKYHHLLVMSVSPFVFSHLWGSMKCNIAANKLGIMWFTLVSRSFACGTRMEPVNALAEQATRRSADKLCPSAACTEEFLSILG